jgi:hypothetical protein
VAVYWNIWRTKDGEEGEYMEANEDFEASRG